MKWPTTSLLRIAGPAPGVLDPTAYVTQAFGEDSIAERIGMDLRVALPATLLEEGQRASLTESGTLVEGDSARRVTGIVVGVHEDVAMAALTSVLRIPVSKPTADDQAIPDKVVRRGKLVVPDDTSFKQANTRAAPIVFDSAGRTALNRGGFAISDEAVFFDGTSPLFSGRAQGAFDCIIDTSSAGAGVITQGWSAADKRSIVQFTPDSPLDALWVSFPLHIPQDFDVFARGEAPPVSFRYRSAFSGMVHPRIVSGNDTLSLISSGDTAWARRAITFDEIEALPVEPGSLIWLVVRMTGAPGAVIALERSAEMRYQPRGDYE